MNLRLPLDGTARTLIRPASKAVFASKYGLEIILAIAQNERVYQTQLGHLSGCQKNQVGLFMKRMEDGGLIEPVESEEGQARHYYRRCPSPLWSFATAWATHLLEPLDESSVTRLPNR